MTTDTTDPARALRRLNWQHRAGALDDADYRQTYQELVTTAEADAQRVQCEYERWGKRCKVQALAWHQGHAYCAHHFREMRGRR